MEGGRKRKGAMEAGSKRERNHTHTHTHTHRERGRKELMTKMHLVILGGASLRRLGKCIVWP